jgi:glycosyltransferase involved in cell wall biosynthesis
MKVLIDGRRSIGGLERYTQGLIRLLATAPGSDRIMVFGRSDAVSPADTRRHSRFRATLGNFRRVLTDQHLMPREARRRQVDLFHSVNYFVPRRLSVPCVVTCHDLWLLDHPKEKKTGWTKYYERQQLLHGLQHADHIITVSDTVAQAIEARFEGTSERITVIHPPLLDLTKIEAPSANLPDMDGRFFLAVGLLEPRKNLERLLDAHGQAYRDCGIPLYLVGPYGWKQQGLLRRISESDGAVRWLGAVSDAVLAELYRQAVSLIAYSRNEGFDYPVAEAMSFGTPVVLSDIPVHREIAGSAGVYAPPDQPKALADRMLDSAALSDATRLRFRQAAQAQLNRIRQRGNAERYLDIYHQVINR